MLLSLISNQLGVAADAICDFELCLFDVQSPTLGGPNQEFIFSARLDNLCMSYCSLSALIQSLDNNGKSLQDDECIRIVGLFDNEEVGSQSAAGADSNLLLVTVKRLAELTSSSKVDTCFSF